MAKMDKKRTAALFDCSTAGWCGGLDARMRERDYPRRAVVDETFDPHYRAETIEVIPPSSEGVAFKPAT